jgi:hypothetical protein
MFNVNLSPNAELCENAVYSRTVFTGMSGSASGRTPAASGGIVLSEMCG